MKNRIERLTALMQRANPLDLERAVRGLLVQFYFHVSERRRLEVVGEGRIKLNVLTPAQFKGAGRFRVHTSVLFGEPFSPGNLACSYFESRTPSSLIEIGAGTTFNNRAYILSEGAGVTIGERVLIGPDLHITDSNSHELDVANRAQADKTPQPVVIGDDVFIGARVTILKGARIGRGCVVSAGTVVPPGFEAPEMSIVAGNPARVVGRVKEAGEAVERAEAAAPAPEATATVTVTAERPAVHRIPVVAVSYNAPELLLNMLASLRKFYPHNPVHIVDGSDAASLAQIREVAAGFEGVTLHAMEYNIHHGPGMAWAIQNLGLTGPVLFLDTDIVVLRAGFLEEMLATLQPGDYGVGGVAYVNREGFDIPYAYGAVAYLHPPCMLCNVEVMREWPMPVKHGAPMVAPMLALHDAGQSGLLRNIDWCMNDVLMGTQKVYIDHIGKGTSSATGGYHLEDWMAEVMTRRERQAAELAASAGAYNPDLLALMPPGHRVIEVGCSTGALAHAYQALHGDTDYWGIEFDPKAAEMARRHCKQVMALDVEAMSDKELAELGSRTCWVFGDVLEHLRDPWRLLARIRKVLPPGGCIVVSVPNAQHWQLQAKLAIGDFRYTDAGVMDRTHLRWFTRITLLEMFAQAGFRMEAGTPRIFDEPEREKVLPVIRAMAEAAGRSPELAVQDALALQYVVRFVAA